MRSRGSDKPLYILPFDHRGSFETGMFGWRGARMADDGGRCTEVHRLRRGLDGFLGAAG